MFGISTMNKNNMMPLLGMLMIVIVMLLMVMLCKSRKERMSESEWTEGPWNKYFKNKRNLEDFRDIDAKECFQKCYDRSDCNAIQYYGKDSRQPRFCRMVHVNASTPVGDSGAPPMKTYTINTRTNVQ